nr:uncharacterized protein LOC127340017 [Lolium perenne]
MRPPSTSATSSSALKGKKRASDRTTAALEARVKKQRRTGPKKVPEAAGAAIAFSKGGGSRPTPSVISPVQRQRREPTPQPTPCARTPPVVVPPMITPPAAGAGSSAAPSSDAPGSGSRSEPARRVGQPTLDDLFPRRTRLIEPAAGAGRGAPGGVVPSTTGAGGAVPDVVVLDASSGEAPPAPWSAIPAEPTASAAPPPSSEPAREEPAGLEPARSADADAQALVTMKGPMEPPQGLHVSKAASLLNVVSASDSSLGSAGTMEKDWHKADACEVTSRDGRPGKAPVEMFFSGFRAYTKAKAAETEVLLVRLEAADKTVSERRTALYNRLVASYHKAKIERADLARELEAAKAVAARVPQLEEDLRAARAQSAESKQAVRTAAAKAKETEGGLARLRRLEANHLTELASIRRVEQEKVDDLSKRLEEVDQQRLKLRDEAGGRRRFSLAAASLPFLTSMISIFTLGAGDDPQV